MNPLPPELLRHVPGCGSGRSPLLVQALTGGRGVNGVWRVCTASGDFVLRLRHSPVDRPGSLARFELASHRLAAGAGLAPRVIDAAPDGRWLVLEFVTAPAWDESRLLTDEGIDALGSVLQRLHQLDCTALAPMEAARIIEGYVGAIGARAPRQREAARARAGALEPILRELSTLPRRDVLNHGDLMAANLLGPAPLLVDWEYAQRTHPTWDVACLLSYYPALDRHQGRLLAACGLGSALDHQILSLQRRLFEGLDRLWQLAEPETG